MTGLYCRDQKLTVGKLTEILSKFDPDLPTLVRGYEGGAHDVDPDITITPAIRNRHTKWYYGPHDVDIRKGEGEPHVFIGGF